ncbi:L-threonylcarbamoyladenylate synthase [Derxia lacustris]|uniref:L-threonylcarbamoyladenylate synthase n=1 Tax=Derxia lacustris TaxID=764842 RepID=UPI0015934121|nr:L-threonylcarbamoyladenylate synthase [Derxia lacustris]
MARLLPADAAGIALGIDTLAAGALVAFATETVYGLGADATRPEAVRRIFAAKGRPADHPVIVHVLCADDLDAWAAEVPPLARALAEAFWPGPLTLVLKRAAGVCDEVTGGQDTVGLRAPAHADARALIAGLAERADADAEARAAGATALPGAQPPARRRSGIAAPSANRFGRISPSLASHVAADFAESDLLVLDSGACAVGIESTIVDLSRGAPVVLRPGAITPAQIAEVAARIDGRAVSSSAAAPRVSGSLASHYAPRKPLLLLDAAAIAALDAPADWAVLAFTPAARDWAWHTQAPRDPAAYAHGLYAWLHAMDGSPARRLAIEAPPADPAWTAVADRLGRAAFSQT